MVIDANMYWFPEELFTNEEALSRFVAEAPRAFDTNVYLTEKDGLRQAHGRISGPNPRGVLFSRACRGPTSAGIPFMGRPECGIPGDPCRSLPRPPGGRC